MPSKLEEFIDHKILNYKENRDFPAIEGTSSLSPYLSSGILSSRQCLFKVFEKFSENEIGVKTWVTEIIWREFINTSSFIIQESARIFLFPKNMMNSHGQIMRIISFLGQKEKLAFQLSMPQCDNSIIRGGCIID